MKNRAADADVSYAFSSLVRIARAGGGLATVEPSVLHRTATKTRVDFAQDVLLRAEAAVLLVLFGQNVGGQAARHGAVLKLREVEEKCYD